jgi:hypothetical protein
LQFESFPLVWVSSSTGDDHIVDAFKIVHVHPFIVVQVTQINSFDNLSRFQIT